MTTVTTKFQLGTAALAMAAAAAITPVVAQADSIAPLAPSLTSFFESSGQQRGLRSDLEHRVCIADRRHLLQCGR